MQSHIGQIVRSINTTGSSASPERSGKLLSLCGVCACVCVCVCVCACAPTGSRGTEKR